MNIIRAKNAGFCMGVARALNKLDTILSLRNDFHVATFGEIIHNPQVIREYEQAGVTCVQSPDQVRENMSLLIRAHGVSREIEQEIRKHCSHVEDATCPRVKKAQLAIQNATANGAVLFLYGEQEHPEVKGLISYACEKTYIFSSVDELENLHISEEVSLVFAAQTTQDRLIFTRFCRILEKKYKDRLTILDTICDATRARQSEAVEIAKQVDIMIVVGGRNSGNTRRLAELAIANGTKTFLVETVSELQSKNFLGVKTVGLTAGASTPKKTIDEVMFFLETIS